MGPPKGISDMAIAADAKKHEINCEHYVTQQLAVQDPSFAKPS